MTGLREHIKGLKAGDPIPAITQPAEIAREGGRIAGEIQDSSDLESQNLLETFPTHACPGRAHPRDVVLFGLRGLQPGFSPQTPAAATADVSRPGRLAR